MDVVPKGQPVQWKLRFVEGVKIVRRGRRDEIPGACLHCQGACVPPIECSHCCMQDVHPYRVSPRP